MLSKISEMPIWQALWRIKNKADVYLVYNLSMALIYLIDIKEFIFMACYLLQRSNNNFYFRCQIHAFD